MTNETTKVDSEEAQSALESIKDLEGIALQQAMSPSWYGVAIALAIGILVFLIGAGLRDYYIFPIIALPIIIAVQRSKAKASIRSIAMHKKTIIALIGLITFMIGLILIALYVRASYGTLLGPIVTGVIATLTVCWINGSERNEYQKKIDQGKRK